MTETIVTTVSEIATEVAVTESEYLAQIAQDLRLLLIIVLVGLTCKLLSLIFGRVLGLDNC